MTPCRGIAALPSLLIPCMLLTSACGDNGGNASHPDARAGGADAPVGVADAAVDARSDAGMDAGSDARVDAADASLDAGADAAIADAGRDAGGSLTLDACFADLPARVGTQMVSTKSSSDGHLRIRIALDTLDLIGTSGTMPWTLIRLGVERNGTVTCVTDTAKLKYLGSHHNCSDSANATFGSLTFELRAPDKASTSLTVKDGSTVIEDSVGLSDTTCTLHYSIGETTCRSGGPC